MNSPPTYEPRRFRATVPYYARYRLGYPDSLIARVVSLAGLRPGDAVLDLGAGPGLLALPFAKAGFRVTAIDPEPGMLEELRASAEEQRLTIDICQGSSFDMPAGVGPFRLVTMGRAFHWMDGAHTLALLDSLVTQDGALAFFDDDHPRTAENAWRRTLRDIGYKYGRGNSSHIVAARQPGFRTHHSLLLDSAFPKIEGACAYVRREITADEVVGLAFSLSTSSRERLGDQAEAFESDLRAALAELSPDGRFTEIAELSALVALRG